MLYDMTGRSKNRTYHTIGREYNTERTEYQLVPYQHYDYPLRPQRTVVQFNSTYMELVDRWDFDRGNLTWIQMLALSIGLSGAGVCLLIFYESLIKGSVPIWVFFFLAFMSLVFLGGVYGVLWILSRELFTYTYFPIRFNRKNGKVYVMGANKQVETYDWGALKIHLQTDAHAPWDVRCCDVDEKGIIKRTFSLPFRYLDTDEVLYGHFEFVNRYMSAKDDKELAEVAKSIRYIFPVHQRKETFKESVQRTLFDYHYGFMNLEYPKESHKKNWFFILNMPFWFLKLLGRRAAVITSKTPHFGNDIEAQCPIDPNDKFDLNKHPPVPELVKPTTLLEKVVYVIMMIVATLVSLSILALIIDVLGAMRPHDDYPSFFKILWDWLLFRWL